MTTPTEWQRLRCDCGSDLFLPVLHLRWRPGGGLTPEPTGMHQCQMCTAVVSHEVLICRAQAKAAKAKAAELQAEADEAAEAAATRAGRPAAKAPASDAGT